MEKEQALTTKIRRLLEGKFGDQFKNYQFPPPVFVTMEGEFAALDLEKQLLTTRFPVAERYLNPYKLLQGGIIAAAVDNTIGPLSVILAPLNVTRQLEMKYSHPVTTDLGYIEVTAKLINREERLLYFSAEVRSLDGLRLARAKAVHYILNE